MDRIKQTIDKTRRPNFTQRETNILVDEIETDPELARGELGKKYRSILDMGNKWDEIANKINATECFNRTGKEVKNKFSDMKTKVKKKAAEIKRNKRRDRGRRAIKIMPRRFGEGIDTFARPKPIDNIVQETEIEQDLASTMLTKEDTIMLATHKTEMRITSNSSKIKDNKIGKKRKLTQPQPPLKKPVLRDVLTNQTNILREMKVTNCLLRKLVVLKNKEVQFLISTNTL
ncbi:unnamed protein product [Ceutorhynchus assimilis]|uniref:Regulatory protein zeste n=1 Tax=Ceutorhynchus assimilis TaxID=467358 RepID=A0A9N9MY05_9CUCU|nr:unnamed protein product [Ceutorhynchus assimilis]